MLFAVTAAANRKPPQHKHEAMACCFCHCNIEDKERDCHKLCELPPDEKGYKRSFNQVENRFCVEVCMLKKEGPAHLKH